MNQTDTPRDAAETSPYPRHTVTHDRSAAQNEGRVMLVDTALSARNLAMLTGRISDGDVNNLSAIVVYSSQSFDNATSLARGTQGDVLVAVLDSAGIECIFDDATGGNGPYHGAARIWSRRAPRDGFVVLRNAGPDTRRQNARIVGMLDRYGVAWAAPRQDSADTRRKAQAPQQARRQDTDRTTLRAPVFGPDADATRVLYALMAYVWASDDMDCPMPGSPGMPKATFDKQGRTGFRQLDDAGRLAVARCIMAHWCAECSDGRSRAAGWRISTHIRAWRTKRVINGHEATLVRVHVTESNGALRMHVWEDLDTGRLWIDWIGDHDSGLRRLMSK